MPLMNLSLAASLEKHKIASDSPWYILLDFSMNGVNLLRFARATDAVTFQGNEYIPFAFDLDLIVDTSNGELQSINLKVANQNRLVEGDLQQYGGGIGGIVTLYVVQASNLDGEVDLTTEFKVTGAQSDVNWATFKLGADNPLRQALPRYIFMANRCRFVFNSPALRVLNDPRGRFCKYAGTETTCTHLLEGPGGCRALGNAVNYGGWPGVDSHGFLAANSQ